MAEIYPLQLLIASVAGWMNQRQGEVLEYLIEENRVLKEQLGGRKLRLTDDQRRRLAAIGRCCMNRARPTGPPPPAAQAPIAAEFGRPSSVIRFSTLQASSASASCALGCRARRRSPRIDL